MLFFSCKSNERQDGRSGIRGWACWYYHQWMDGLLSFLWVYAEHSALCKRQISGKNLSSTGLVGAWLKYSTSTLPY